MSYLRLGGHNTPERSSLVEFQLCRQGLYERQLEEGVIQGNLLSLIGPVLKWSSKSNSGQWPWYQFCTVNGELDR